MTPVALSHCMNLDQRRSVDLALQAGFVGKSRLLRRDRAARHEVIAEVEASGGALLKHVGRGIPVWLEGSSPTVGCPAPARVPWTIGDIGLLSTLWLFQRLTLSDRPLQRIVQRAADD